MRPRLAGSSLLTALLLTIAWTGRPAAQPAERDDAQVVAELMRVLERSPRRGAAMDRLYGLHVERGRLDQLLATLRQRTKDDAKDGVAWMLVGLLEAQRGRDAAAVEAFGQAEKHRPKDPLASYYLGQSLVLVGKPPEAAEAFERAIARGPARADLLDVYQALGRVHQRARQADKAIAVWKRLEERFPADRRVQEQIANALAEDGQHEQALRRFEALAKAAREANDSLKEPHFRTSVADLKAQLGRRDEALKDYEALLADLPPDDWKFADVRGRLEEVFLRADDLAGLVKYYEARVEKHPEDLGAVSRLAHALVEQGRTADAIGRLVKALDRAPRNAGLRLDLIHLLVGEQKTAEAAAHYEALNRNDPNNPDHLRQWGLLLFRDTSRPEDERRQRAADVWRRLLPPPGQKEDPVRLGQVADLFRQGGMTDDALALYRRAAELAPGPSPQRVHLGEFFNSLGRKDEALATWRAMAEGQYRDVRNLRHLAEVLSGFGYQAEALTIAEDAVTLDPRDFGLRLLRAELLHQAGRHPDALSQLDEASRLAPGPEEAELVLDRQVRTHQSGGTLIKRIAELQKEAGATPLRRYELARFAEADRRWTEAAAAIREALKGDKDLEAVRRLNPARAAAARIHEGAGDLAAASVAFRHLAQSDRPRRADHFAQVMRLEERLGRRAEALQAGRDLVAAAPDNLPHARSFAGLCVRLGEVEEGLEVLRKAVRQNPNDVEPLSALARALADQFRSAEAVELYWRVFDRAEGDGKLAAVDQLASLYIRTNQLDRLLERLERLRRGPATRRLAALSIARAHTAAGDLGTARKELEQVLAESPTDLSVLRQLASLAERENDLTASVRYLRLLARTDRTAESQLASLLLRSGETEEAVGIWQRQAAAERRANRLLQLADNLLLFNQYDRAAPVVGALLRDQPQNWEALYRQGILLSGQGKTVEAEKAFRALLALQVPDDELTELIQQRPAAPAKGPVPKAAPKGPAPKATKDSDNAVLDRVQAVTAMRPAIGMTPPDPNRRSLWAPGDFGQARMAALGWLWVRAQADKKQDQFVAELRAACKPDGADLRPWWDFWYLSLVRSDALTGVEARHVLVKCGLPAVYWYYINGIGERDGPRPATPGTQGTPVTGQRPLPATEIDKLLTGYDVLIRRKPEWVYDHIYEKAQAELKLAGRQADADRLYRETVAAATVARLQLVMMRMAAARGDLDTFTQLFARFEPLRKTPAVGTWNPRDDLRTTFQKAMDARVEANAPADVPKLLEMFLDFNARTTRADRASRVAAATTPQPLGSVNFNLKTYRRTLPMDFPAPGTYLGRDALMVLGNTLMLYQKTDLVTDLFAFMRARVDKAKPEDRAHDTMALAALHWWNGNRDGAVREAARAVAAAPGDPELRLELARAQLALNRPDEALATIDGTEAADSATLQNREWAALDAATRAGNADRARQAAERLGGLRLDAEALTRLAGRMHQLGMPQEASAALARARGQAGGRNDALLALMRQYRAQNQGDKAAEVAHQILRGTPAGQAATTPGLITPVAQARSEALQALAGSGRLAEMIRRTEAQIQGSPRSLPLLQALSEYHQAAGNSAKVKEVAEQMARLKPDDPALRYQLAEQIARTDPVAALEHYLAAIRKQPRLFNFNSYFLIPRFQSAGKLADLGSALEASDLRQAGVSDVARVAGALVIDKKTKTAGLRLFRKLWDVAGAERERMFVYLDSSPNSPLWSVPEIYDMAHAAVVPPADERLSDPWARFGRLVPRLATLADQRGRLPELTRQVQEAVARRPEWAGGRALVAVLEIRSGHPDRAKPLLTALFDDKTVLVPAVARDVLVQEMESAPVLHDLAIRVCEQAVPEALAGDRYFSLTGSLAGRLVELYKRAGRPEDARALLRKLARTSLDQAAESDWSMSYTRKRNLETLADQLLALDAPLDAARIHAALVAEGPGTSLTPRPAAMEDYEMRQRRQKLDQAIQAVGQAVSADVLRGMLTPREGKGDGPALDLALLVNPRESDKAALQSLLTMPLQAAAEAGLPAEVKVRLDELAAKYPRDFSVQVAVAVPLLAKGDGPGAADALAKLEDLARQVPLEELPAGTRANARQRATAAEQVPLWLAARASLKHKSLRDAGRRLADRAAAAAARQTDTGFALAIRREWGQIELEAGDKEAAGRHWGAMLDLTLGQARGPKGVAVPIETFVAATQLAKLAAANGQLPLSYRAVREALRAGPPVVPVPKAPTMPRVGPIVEASPESRIGTELRDLERLWQKHGAAAGDVYEALAAAVLPAGRPAEVFPYPAPLLQFTFLEPAQARSAAASLGEWAVKAGRADDLRKRVEARMTGRLAEVPARVLLAHLGRASGDPGMAADALDWLEKRLDKDGTRPTAELVCHAALPVMNDPSAGKAARAAAGRAATALAAAPDGKMLASAVRMQLGPACLRAGDRDAGRHHLREFVRLEEESSVGVPDYQTMMQKMKLWMATKEFADAGFWDDGWETLGQATDLPPITFMEFPEAPGLLGPLARGLAGRPAADRYVFLKAWVLPSPTRKAIRLVAGPAGDDSVPPAAFGKFAAPPAGLVSSLGLLIDAARAAGKLEELETEARAAVAVKAPNAESLLRLVLIARGHGKEVEAWVRQRADEVVKKLAAAPAAPDSEFPIPRPTTGYPAAERWADLVLARACLADPVLREPGEKMAAPLADYFQRTEAQFGLGMGVARGLDVFTQGLGSGGVVQGELAILRALRAAGESARSSGTRLALWFDDRPRPPDRPLAGWLAHERHLTIAPGSATRRLHFAYPLAGTFELSFEASNLGHVEYAGRAFNLFDPMAALRGRLPVGVGSSARDDFRRFTLQVTPDRVRCLIDGRPVFEDVAPDPASPWLVLTAGSGGQPVFRNLSLTGTPQVPREVPLVRGDRLSWSAEPATIRAKSAADPFPMPFDLEALKPEVVWSATGGVVTGRRDTAQAGRPPPSQLQLGRPLRPGESVSYEFLYEPDRTAVFPSLDRLAVLLAPDGVRLHWARGDEAFGLKEDNAVADPDGRRGPERLPLRAGEWNEVKLTLDGDVAVLELNGAKVHEHKLDPANDRRFGLFHFRSRTEAKARNVVLRGNWPESLAADRLADLTAPAAPLTPAERRLRHALIGEDLLAGGALDLVRRARGLGPEARYELLRGWVLPGPDHPTLRLNGGFSPFEPVPPDASNGRGGSAECPARELVATAGQLGRLPELAKLIEAAAVETDRDRRGQAALSAMVAVAAGRDADANVHLTRLKDLLGKVSATAGDGEYWPELNAALTADNRRATRPRAAELLGAVVERLGTGGSPSGLAGHARTLLATMTNETADTEPRTAMWHATTLPTALSRSAGRPRPVWTVRGAELVNHTGHADDVAFFSVPLRGDFEVSGELTLDGRRAGWPAYGDLVFELQPDGKQVRVSQPGRAARPVRIEPPLKPTDGWVGFRLVFQAGSCTLHADGRSIATERLPTDPAPWVSVRPGPGGGGIRGVKVTGKPVIPEALDLSGPRRMGGWAARYYGESVSEFSPAWEWRANEIRAKADRDGMGREKLLQYMRPLLEDGEIEYEFRPVGGKARIHPALDRLAMVIEDGGVRIHWLTNGEHDRTGLAADNRTDEPASRVGPAELPLKPSDWNKVKVAVAGNRVTLSLNGVEVFRRDLEPMNRRVFGLFHEPGAAESAVRSVRYRGAYSKELPKAE